MQTNLPTQFTRFVGRETEISWFSDCLDVGIYRFIAFIGMAGVGKTRLAIQAGSTILNQFPDGVWFVPLSGVNAIEEIVPAILSAMGIPLNGKDPSDRLLIHISNKEALLIIDNFEHLLAGANILFEILRNSPKLIILVTSQQRMNYQSVSSLYLQGLPCPDDPNSGDLLNYAGINSLSLGQTIVCRVSRSIPKMQVTLFGSVNWWGGYPLVSSWLQPASGIFHQSRSLMTSNRI